MLALAWILCLSNLIEIRAAEQFLLVLDDESFVVCRRVQCICLMRSWFVRYYIAGRGVAMPKFHVRQVYTITRTSLSPHWPVSRWSDWVSRSVPMIVLS